MKAAEHTSGCSSSTGRAVLGTGSCGAAQQSLPQPQLPVAQGVPRGAEGQAAELQQRGAGSTWLPAHAANSCSSCRSREQHAQPSPAQACKGSFLPRIFPPALFTPCEGARSLSLPPLPSHTRELCPKITPCTKICSQNTKPLLDQGFCPFPKLQAPYPGTRLPWEAAQQSTGIPRNVKAQERLKPAFHGQTPESAEPLWKSTEPWHLWHMEGAPVPCSLPGWHTRWDWPHVPHGTSSAAGRHAALPRAVTNGFLQE